MDVHTEIVQHCVKPTPYKGWVSTYCGAGSVVFEKPGHKNISAYRGWDVKDWLKETWLECKSKIDAIEG